ncbi:MAG: phosphodiester glycosidase family protein [Bacteroidota bacterium]
MRPFDSVLVWFGLLFIACQPSSLQETSPSIALKVNYTDSITTDPRIAHYVCDPTKVNIKFYWEGKNDRPYGNIGQLKESLEASGESLLFAMNGGMYHPGQIPAGLYVEDGVELYPMNETEKAPGNLFLQPNGVFFITEDQEAVVVSRYQFEDPGNIQYATQSGPMLLIDGAYHPKFNRNSTSLNLRNGVGILPDGKVLFALSEEQINFYDFATFFKENGCQNALYLDGFVSKAYMPEQGIEQFTGQLGVLIGVTATN